MASSDSARSLSLLGFSRIRQISSYHRNALKATEYLPSLAGAAWEDTAGAASLTPDQQRLIKRAAIDIKIVKRESDEDAKYDLFQRLNTGGSQLSDQEVRNCLLIMVRPEFYGWIRSLRDLDVFQEDYRDL